MIKNTTQTKTQFTLTAVYDEKSLNKDIVKNQNQVTEFVCKKEAFIYLGKKDKVTVATMKAVSAILAKTKRDYQIKVETFVTKTVSEEEVVTQLVEQHILANGDVYSMKTKKKEKHATINLLGLSAKGKKAFATSKHETEVRNWVRSFQVMPPNVLNSVNFAQKLKTEFTAKHKNVSVKVLNKKQITELKMGLMLGVNAGSAFDPRVVVLEYKGNPSSKEKTTYVGKGIMFDSGGYSIKTGRHMSGMKYDMSGSAIIAGAMKLISKNKPKANISAVLMLTDNSIGTNARSVDGVDVSMSGKTVEINNTDAEGRLVLADGITYAIKKLNTTRIIDVATLTGAVLVALGNTFTGVWTTEEKDWNTVSKAAEAKGELVWRLPFHEDFDKYIKGSKIADLRNTDFTGKGGSSSAAGFLRHFTEGKPYVHFDIAGTADVDEVSTAVLTKTLAEAANG